MVARAPRIDPEPATPRFRPETVKPSKFAQPFRDYEILDRLGSGGMGTVFKARRKDDGVVVALKVCRAVPPMARKRLAAAPTETSKLHAALRDQEVASTARPYTSAVPRGQAAAHVGANLSRMSHHVPSTEHTVTDFTAPARSTRFGGLWTDASTARTAIEARRQAATIDASEAAALATWTATGIWHLPQAVPAATVDRILADVDAAWQGHIPGILVEHFVDGCKIREPARPELRSAQAKVLDLHAFSEAARSALFAPPLRRALELLFDEPPLAFQSLCMWRGTQQPAHQDAAFVRLRRPMEFVGTWLALEDIEPGSGELFYFPGSHTFEDYLFDGRFKGMPPPYDAAKEQAYCDWLQAQVAARGLELSVFRPRKGDAVIWHADLAHGGLPYVRPGSTRKSLVTHFCPKSNEPVYFLKELHSAKHPHPSGGYWCHACWCDERRGKDLLRKALALGKRAVAKLRWRVR